LLIDLHCHTRVYSSCSVLTPDALVRAARTAGLDGVCITEHDALWPADELRAVAAEFDFLVLAGVEVSTDAGHVLAYGLRAYGTEFSPLRALRRRADEDGALLYMSHPVRSSQLRKPAALEDSLDSLEVCNGSEGALANETAQRLATSFRLPGVGGSDAHSAREVGACATEFENHVGSMEDLLRELRAGRYRAVSLR
jgi:predicted metal-dependent phosphoesterase TrpH